MLKKMDVLEEDVKNRGRKEKGMSLKSFVCCLFPWRPVRDRKLLSNGLSDIDQMYKQFDSL